MFGAVFSSFPLEKRVNAARLGVLTDKRDALAAVWFVGTVSFVFVWCFPFFPWLFSSWLCGSHDRRVSATPVSPPGTGF